MTAPAFATVGHDAALRIDLDHRPSERTQPAKQWRNTNAESVRRSSNLPFGRLSPRAPRTFDSADLLYLRATLLRLCFLVEVALDLALLISPAWGCVCQSRLEIGAIWRLYINIRNVTRAARACCERRLVQPSRGFWKTLPSSR
ncbi:hypothetical protein MXD81_02745 [Microbacteriaceae bacterium K1510]|jgi:hypothetical protein|nr:hypothetical protein [Microbacteriaceae bacterium K1510]